MAEYGGRHMGQGNASDLHHPRQLPVTGGPLVACRFCDAVFSSSQALINHIGSHMPDEGGAASRRQHPRYPTCRFPAPPRATQLIFPNRFAAPNSIGADAELLWQHQISVSPYARNVFRDAPPYPPPAGWVAHWSAAEEAASDSTKPYINQLEKCIPKVADGAEEDDGRQLYLSTLDLTLKL